ncbi:MAG: DUF502 domain-containing protein [Thermoanaerobaculia bacterium]|jgi:uncharacterized membrane protein
MNFIAKNFLRGLAIVIPTVVTAYILYQTFLWIDRLILFPFPGLGVLVTFVAIVLIGILASNYVIAKLLAIPEAIFSRAPLVKILYSSIKDLIEAFVGDRKRFNNPVLVVLGNSPRVEALGFVTAEDLGVIGAEGSVAVYFPQAYNFAGNLVIVPRESVRAVDGDPGRVMAFIVSGGVSGGLDAQGIASQPRS